MYKPKSELLKELYERGYVHQCTDVEKLDKIAENNVITGYIGLIALLKVYMLEV